MTITTPIDNITTIACHECGVLHQFRPLKAGSKAYCIRCGAILYRYRANWVAQATALWFSAVVLFIIINSFPLFTIKTQGMLQELSLVKTVSAFWQSDLYVISGLLALNLLVFPLLELLMVGWILLTLRFHWQPMLAVWLFRWLQEFKPWSMLEVFMLGALVAIVKLGDMASLVMGIAFWSFSAHIIVLAALHSVFEPFWVWRALGQLQQSS